MKSNAFASLDCDATTAKRAQFEAFEFAIEAPGPVRVTNGSYGDEKDDHSYLVNVENGVPTACECKAFEYGGGKACKHMTAVAIREPIMHAARTSMNQQVVRADGGQEVEDIGKGWFRVHEGSNWFDVQLSNEGAHGCICENDRAYYCEHEKAVMAHNDRPIRSEPADFGGGESTGVQEL